MGKKENELSKNDEVCTPAEVFKPVLDALGWDCFDLDPCSHPRAIVPVKRRILLPRYMKQCAQDSRWSRKEERGQFAGEHVWNDAAGRELGFGDGLKVTWRKQRVWMNPPYSQLQYTKKYLWLEKAASEAGRCVGWLPARTSSQWWQEYVRRAAAVCLWKGRVQHLGEKWGSPFHQALVFWGFNKREVSKLERALDAHYKGRHWFFP